MVLDGATSTQLNDVVPPPRGEADEPLWSTWGLLHAPDAVLGVHRAYLRAGCDVLTTNTWGLTDASGRAASSPAMPQPHWMDLARRGLHIGRQAIADAGRTGEVALAFSVNGDVDTVEKRETLELLTRVFADEPPDLILLETMTLIREELTFSSVQLMLDTGLPVWLSFRRCRSGVCGVYGQHWGGPEGDEFGRAAKRFEEMGVSALLMNCVPPDHVAGMLPWLRDFTDLPLGVYPNLGYYTNAGWNFDRTIGPGEYADLAMSWREEGAQIIGGCCGVGPELIAAAGKRLRRTDPEVGHFHERVAVAGDSLVGTASAGVSQHAWRDDRGRNLYPLPFPHLVVEPGVFVPTQGSFLIWKHLFAHDIGAGARCLDIGCGTGVLAVQLAINGARSVHALDIDPRAVANTLANAFRNGVADRVTGAAVDLYPWAPDETYDVVAASLYQMPVDPYERPTSHRPLDFWGRNLLDHLLTLLPRLLAPGGVAYVMQLSILGQQRTQMLLDSYGLTARVVEMSPFPFTPIFADRSSHIERVEALSDAYHLTFGDQDVMVAYLLEIRAASGDGRGTVSG